MSVLDRPVPRESGARCALRAQLRDDPLIATAFPASRLLLVEQPGPWGRAGLAESHFDPDVARRLGIRAGRAGMRLQAIRRPGRTPAGTARRWLIADTTTGAEGVRAGTYHDDRELLELPLDAASTPGDDQAGPLHLVCTHSKHDACCALRGRAVAAALAAERPDRVWETTHLGGERFAANVLVLPSGLLYGRVLPFAAHQFVAAADDDEVIGALLRGRIGARPVAQAAWAYALEHLGLRNRHAVQVLTTGPVIDHVALVRLRVPDAVVEVAVRVEARTAFGLTCSAPGPGTYLAHHAVSLTPLAAG